MSSFLRLDLLRSFVTGCKYIRGQMKLHDFRNFLFRTIGRQTILSQQCCIRKRKDRRQSRILTYPERHGVREIRHDGHIALQYRQRARAVHQRVQHRHVLLLHSSPDRVLVSPLRMVRQRHEEVHAPCSRPRHRSPPDWRTVRLPLDVLVNAVRESALHEGVGRSPPPPVVPPVGVVGRSPVGGDGLAAVDGARPAFGRLVLDHPR
mmetsp:Transcript_5164/g.11193  ORF Transcript_5164/g.11193 Transcript_5164/m.11193 type:complete len:206 (+) Transcript_5164:422-1039(+)